jgi:hypothetical protein
MSIRTVFAASLLAAATAACLHRAVPDFSGRWVPVDAQSRDSGFVIEQTDSSVTMVVGDGSQARLSFGIQEFDDVSLRLKGPTAAAFVTGGGRFRLDATADSQRVSGSIGGGSFNLSMRLPLRDSSMVVGRIRLVMERDGTMRYQMDVPGKGGSAGTHTEARFRRR